MSCVLLMGAHILFWPVPTPILVAPRSLATELCRILQNHYALFDRQPTKSAEYLEERQFHIKKRNILDQLDRKYTEVLSMFTNDKEINEDKKDALARISLSIVALSDEIQNPSALFNYYLIQYFNHKINYRYNECYDVVNEAIERLDVLSFDHKTAKLAFSIRALDCALEQGDKIEARRWFNISKSQITWQHS